MRRRRRRQPIISALQKLYDASKSPPTLNPEQLLAIKVFNEWMDDLPAGLRKLIHERGNDALAHPVFQPYFPQLGRRLEMAVAGVSRSGFTQMRGIARSLNDL